MRRVVVTGMGMLSPLGKGVKYNWSKIISGKSGIGKITGFDVSDLSSQIAGTIPVSDENVPPEGFFNKNLFVSVKEQRKMDTFICYAMAAADEAIKDSGWQPDKEESLFRTGVMIGSGIMIHPLPSTNGGPEDCHLFLFRPCL
jgi:3-oxoacyl-[acyl-carrier-protein] synthase II